MQEPKIFEPTYKNFQHAWHGINEFLAFDCFRSKYTHAVSGNQIFCYNVNVRVKLPRVDPNFDYGYCFGYTMNKWSTLVRNYVNREELLALRAEIHTREEKKHQAYNISMNFDNSYVKGKGCLSSVIISRQYGNPVPIIYFAARVIEVTNRMIFDFLLFQRICEFVYKPLGIIPEVRFISPSIYLVAERFSMYSNAILDMDQLFEKNVKEGNVFHKRLWDIYKKFSTVAPETIAYKSHARAAYNIQKDEDGNNVSGRGGLLAKNLNLEGPLKINAGQF